MYMYRYLYMYVCVYVSIDVYKYVYIYIIWCMDIYIQVHSDTSYVGFMCIYIYIITWCRYQLGGSKGPHLRCTADSKQDGLCWFYFFLCFGAGGRSCSNLLASAVDLTVRHLGNCEKGPEALSIQGSPPPGDLHNRLESRSHVGGCQNYGPFLDP